MDSLWKQLFGGIIFLLMVACLVHGQCTLTKTLVDADKREKSTERSDLLHKLNGLTSAERNRKHSSREFEQSTIKYEYIFQLCPDETEGSIGIEQMNIAKQPPSRVAVIGRHNEVDIHASARGDLYILTYTKGENYKNACNGTERHAIIVIRCIPGISDYKFDMIDESAGMDEDFCYYSFELLVPPGGLLFAGKECPSVVPPVVPSSDASSSRVGPAASGDVPAESSPHHGLGAGSIIVILILVSVMAFFMIGSVYKRFVVGAQGWEQVPFIDFWRRCGTRDGWRHAFGRGGRHGNAYDDYTAVSTDEERQPALDRNGHDDHLLPM